MILAALLCASALVASDVNRPAQRFLLPDVAGRNHDFNEYRGKVVVLEFMQTTCPHCGAFTSVLKEAQQRYGDRVAIISLVNPPDTPATVSNFIAAHQIKYPILLDAGRVAYAYIRRPAFDIPYLFLIDASGNIRKEFEYGPANQEIFEGKGLFPHLDAVVGSGSASPPGKKK
jgi:peroxiredoxin